jgi:acetyl esterase/lipase
MTVARVAPLLAVLLLPAAFAQGGPQVIPLWPKGAPGFESRRDIPEEAKDYWVRSINNPSITVFPAPRSKANGCAIVVAPGGGFRELVFDAEGIQAASYLNSIGVTVFVLKYRLPKEKDSPYTLDNVRQDAYRALRIVRSRAAEFQVDPHRIGMMGFSVGGIVVNQVAYAKAVGDPAAAGPVERVSGRPDFEVIVYPGEPAPQVVPPDTGPAFLVCATDDEYGCDQVTLDLYERFRAAKVPVEAHFFERGKHAFNMGYRSPYSAIRGWPNRLADWLGDSGFLKPADPGGPSAAGPGRKD